LSAALPLQDARRPSAFALGTFVVVTAILYLAREVLIPLALAILFTLLLAPAVRRLERWHLNRLAATLAVTVLALAVVGGVGWVTGNQFISLLGKLPEYREHIVKKLQAVRSPPKQGPIGKAAEAIKQLEKDTAPAGQGARQPEPPKPAAQSALPTTLLEFVSRLGVPALTALATAIAVIALTILMLLQRDDLRDRLIRLVGSGRMHATTQAMQDAAQRVSRYLMMQFVVNACFGVPLGIILYFLGIPNAALWGLLATVLRFVPYIGSWIAGSMPVLLAIAISDDWSLALWTLGTIVVLETTVAYAIEPWLYGQSTGLSPLAIIAAVVFWSWLWGPIGLLLATPLTVCVAVIGRHVPQFGFLNVMLGVEPVLPPEMRFYQRLLALEHDEALDVAQRHATEHDVTAAREQVLVPALALAKRDRQREALTDTRERFVYDTIIAVLDEVGGAEGTEPPAVQAPVDLCILPAQDEPDYIASLVLARELAEHHFNSRVVPHSLLAAEAIEQIGGHCRDAVCISALPPSAAARYLCKRLRRAFPTLKIVVALWVAEEGIQGATERLKAAGADEVVTRLGAAVNKIRELIVPHALANNSDQRKP
jgi:predicted PurR-regulated permease PerM